MAEATSWLFIIASGPYRHDLDSDPAIDIVMAAGAFGQQTMVLFMGDGLGYLDTKISAPDGHSDLRKLLKSLPLYEVETVHVVAEEESALPASLSIPVEAIDTGRVSELFARADHVVTF